MSTILNIETSGKICSVALTREGALEFDLENREGMKHAEVLAPFVERAMEEVKRKEWKLDAVAVSIGPGSYTGLRIGLSLAKGLAFSLGVPLIGVSTLKILAVKAMFRNFNFTGEEILVPMIDARRMEVFTGAYDFALNAVAGPGPMILDSESLPKRKYGLWETGRERRKMLLTLPMHIGWKIYTLWRKTCLRSRRKH